MICINVNAPVVFTEKESAKISEISGREKRRKFPADNAG